MTARFEVGKTYYAESYYGWLTPYIVLKRNDETHRITIQSIASTGTPIGKKMTRKITEHAEYERVVIEKATETRVRGWYTGGSYMSSLDEVEE